MATRPPVVAELSMAYSHAEQTGGPERRAHMPSSAERARRLAGSLSWPLAVTALLYLLLLALGTRLLNDADSYWQVALGHWIMAHGAVPHVDTFSFTMAGKPWISSEWLAQALYAEAYDLLGWTGVVVLAAAAIAAAFGLLTRFLLERLAPKPALVLVGAAFVLASSHMLARPHVLAMPVMVVWVAGLVRALDERRLPSFVLLPLMTLWANLHGGFTFGIALLAPVGLEALLRAAPAERLTVALRWGLFGVLALAAACITPYGPQSILVTARVLGLGPALALIGEWQPQDFATVGGFMLCLLAGIGFALHRGITLPPIRLLVLLGLLYMALSHDRNAELLGMLGPLFIAAPLARQFGGREDTKPAAAGGGRRIAPFALVAGLAVATVGAAYAAHYRPRAAITPARAVAAIGAAGKTRILNSYDFGGYLIAAGLKPFIDGRTELYGKDFMLRNNRAVTLEDVSGFLRLLKKYKIDATLLATGVPANGLLAHLSGWKRLYADGVAVVYVRDGAPAAMKGVRP
ncbi:MAG: hypothetical protein P8Z80_06410 [Pseudolabrys sp.]